MKTKTNLAYIILLLFITNSLVSCESESINGNKLDLLSLTEKAKTDSSFFFINVNKDTSKVLEKLDTEIPTTRNDLASMRTVVKIINGNQNAGVSIPGFGGLTLGKEETSLSVYYIETKVVDTSVYGIGYSVHYLFKKIKRGISVSDLPKVAASVQLESNKTQVFYSLQSYGIKSLSLVNYFKPVVNKDFNVEGYGLMQSSIDGIHNNLSDSLLSSKVKFEPMLLKIVKPSDLQE